MELWIAVVFFIAALLGCVICAVVASKKKSKKLTVLAVFFGLAMFALAVYVALTLIFVDGIQSSSPPKQDDSPALTETGFFTMIDPIIDEAILIIDEVRQDNLSHISFDYEKQLKYDILNEEEKVMYDEMIAKVRDFESFTYTAKEYGYDVLDRVLVVFGAINHDWPELENYFNMAEVVEGNMTVALESRYFMPGDPNQEPATIDALREETALYDAICGRIVERMPSGLSAYDKYRYLATVISLSTDYDHTLSGGWQISSAYGSIVGGHSICQGYSRGFMALCERADLWCVTVSGVAGENESHMWNMVKLDAGNYHVDVTWSDELGTPTSKEWLGYFMLTEEEISVDHIID